MKFPFIRQHDEKDCGAACLSMISEYFGLKLTIAKCRELIKVDGFGANIYGIVTGAEKLGLNAVALTGNDDELMQGISDKSISLPFIARIVNEEMFEHFVVVFSIKKQIVTVGDPGKTKLSKVSLNAFLDQWQGQIITFAASDSFSRGNLRNGSFSKFFKHILRQKKLLAMVFVASLIISAISLFSATIFEYVVDNAVQVGDINHEYSEEDEHDHNHDHEHEKDETGDKASVIGVIEKTLSPIFNSLETVCLSIIALYLIQAVLRALRAKALAMLGKRIDLPISLGFYDHLIELSAEFFGTRSAGELMSRFSDAASIREAVASTTLTIMLDTLMAAVTGIYLLLINVKLFLITLVIMALYALIMVLFRRPIRTLNQNVMESNARVTAYLKESIDGMETIKAYKHEDASKAKTKRLYERFIDQLVASSILHNNLDILTDLIESIGMVAILWLGAYLCLGEIISVGVLITFYFLLEYFISPVKNLIGLQPVIQTALVAADRLNDVLDASIEDNDRLTVQELKGDISFNGINFRYGNRSLVLNNIDLHIVGGKKVAIIGESGCGKTTLVKLLTGFYSPESGSISIGEKLLSDYSPKSVRNRIVYVPQKTFLFADSIYNNLRMGKATVTNEEIESICRLCSADEFINSLPFGYETILEENGNNLSNGQKQRLAIARALLLKPDILILDEATSSLDSITEKSINRIINELSSSMTVIIIAHRLSTIRNCDSIIVMNNGAIVETGCHEDLMNNRGYYYRLLQCNN